MASFAGPPGERTVLVIGATGAIGRSLVAQLCASGVTVVAAVRRTPLPESLVREYGGDGGRLKLQSGVDVRDADSIARAFAPHARVDAVWMLAAPLSVESAKDPAAARDVVVGGLERLLRVMSARGVPRICFSDSIGSFGRDAPREGCSASWLTAHPEQDPGSAYGRQKRECREIMRAWVEEDELGRRSSRFAVIPGVLHTDESWGDGTTEYALEAIKYAASGEPYVCPIDPDQKLPMIMRDDLARGLCALTFADDAREPQGGYAIAGLSFTPAELFAEIAERVPAFTWSIASDSAEDSPAKLFAALWPDSLSGEEAARDLGFTAETTTLGACVGQILAGWRSRQSGDGEESAGDNPSTAAADASDDNWWKIAGPPSPIGVLLLTANRMEDFREGGYEENLIVNGSAWSVGVLPARLEENQLAAVQSAGAETLQVWEERCEALDRAGHLDERMESGIREEALRSLHQLHRVLSEIGVSPLDLQRAAALT